MEYKEICNNDLYLALKALEDNVEIFCEINGIVYDKLSVNDADKIILKNSKDLFIMDLNDFVSYCAVNKITIKVLMK